MRWLLKHRVQPVVGPESPEDHAVPQAWWKVMCLTGVDYFSNLSYLPAIAALAAGAVSPLATLLIVALTLLGMLPENPYIPEFLNGQAVLITVVLLLILGGVFPLGFSEAVVVAIPLVAVFLVLNAVVSALRRGQRRAGSAFGLLSLILLYALAANVIEKPDGVAISGFFILGIIAISLVSRIARTTELRSDIIRFDDTARRFIADSLDYDGALNLIAHRRQTGDAAEYAEKEVDQRGQNAVPGTADVSFLEIDIIDPSNFEGTLDVHGVDVDGHRILRVKSPAAPNAIAAT